MTDLLPVTQADRDAVRAFHAAMFDKLMTAVKDKKAGDRMGKDEGDAGTLVQAFARHRLTHSSEEGRLREALEQIAASETKWGNATVRRMAEIARTALSGSTLMEGMGE